MLGAEGASVLVGNVIYRPAYAGGIRQRVFQARPEITREDGEKVDVGLQVTTA